MANVQEVIVRIVKTMAIAGLAISLIGNYTFGQRGGGNSDRGGSGGSAVGSRGGGQSDRVPTGVRIGSQPSPHSAAIATNAPTTTPRGGYSNYGGNQSYYYPSYAYMSTCNFLYGLWRQYPYFNWDYYAYRYSEGDSPIDRNLLRLALSDSHKSASAMQTRVNKLSSLVDQFEQGQIGRKQFQDSFEATLKEIRKLSKSIRNDERLKFLDQRRSVSVKQPPAATSIPELRRLVAELSDQVTEMKNGLETYYVRDYTRVIDLNHLKQPSFKSVSERIDKLAKSIEKSADRM